MSVLSDKTSQYILDSCAAIEEIGKPFFQATGIRLFVFNRTHPFANPGKGFFLTNHRAWCEQFLEKDYHHRLSFAGVGDFGTVSGYKLLFFDLFPDNIMIKNLHNDFRIDHAVLICKQFPDYIEWYSFGLDSEKKQNNSFYVNHFEDIINFVHAFKDRAKSIIKKISKMSTLPFPIARDEQKIFLNEVAKKMLWKDPLLIEMSASYRPKHYEFFINNITVILTGQEYKCIQGLLLGLSIKQIAKQLNLSPRTIETYLCNARNKAQITDRQQLIEAFRSEVTSY